MKKAELKNKVITALEEMNLVTENYLENDNELDEAFDLQQTTLNDATNVYVTTEPLNVFYSNEEGREVLKTANEDDNGIEAVLKVIEIDDLSKKIYITLTYDI